MGNEDDTRLPDCGEDIVQIEPIEPMDGIVVLRAAIHAAQAFIDFQSDIANIVAQMNSYTATEDGADAGFRASIASLEARLALLMGDELERRPQSGG